jgi:hypothetical protein
MKKRTYWETDVKAEDNIGTEREIARMRGGRNNSGHQ